MRTLALHLLGIISLPFLLIRKVYFVIRYKSGEKYTERCALKAINKANELAKATGYKYIVFMSGGKVVIKPKRMIKGLLLSKGKYFAPGTTMRNIEKRALYITN